MASLWRPFLVAAILTALLWWPSRQGGWWFAVLIVGFIEYVIAPRLEFRERLLAVAPYFMMAASTGLIISLLPKALSQLAVAGLYGLWRLWAHRLTEPRTIAMRMLIVQAAVFEAIFLAAAVWNQGPYVTLVLVWFGAFLGAYILLRARSERSAVLLASVWALIATECSWIFTTWLVSYVTQGSFVIVPQPALVLSALAYCFGSIYIAQRENRLSRSRLAEYFFIALIVLAVVIAGTPWHGSV